MDIPCGGWMVGVTFSFVWILIGSPLNFPALLENSCCIGRWCHPFPCPL